MSSRPAIARPSCHEAESPRLRTWPAPSASCEIGRPLYAFVDEEGQAIISASMNGRRHGSTKQHDLRLCRPDGSVLWVIVSASPLFNQKGQYAGALVMVA